MYFFPPQNIYKVPLSDGGSNLGRLEALRLKLGWEVTGPREDGDEDNPLEYMPLISR